MTPPPHRKKGLEGGGGQRTPICGGRGERWGGGKGLGGGARWGTGGGLGGGSQGAPSPNRERSLAGMRKRRRGAEAEEPGEEEKAELESTESELSDAEHYRKEVGLEPEAGEGKGGRSWKVTGRKWGWNRKRVREGGPGRLQEGSGAGTGSG